MASWTARPHQTEGAELVVTSAAKGLILHVPCGGGKTDLEALIAKQFNSSLTLKPMRGITSQSARSREVLNQDVAIWMAGEDEELNLQLTRHVRHYVATWGTFRSWIRRNLIGWPSVEVVIVDEAHLLSATQVRDLCKFQENGALVVGLTGTPTGVRLSHVYEELHHVVSIKELVAAGYLVPCRYYAPITADLASISVTRGDYSQSEADKLLSKPSLVGELIDHIPKYAGVRSTIVYCSGVASSVAAATQLTRTGYTAEHIDGSMPDQIRQPILERHRSGTTQILCNSDLLTFGHDAPHTSCIVLYRPTKSIALHHQMIGRGVRAYEGKDDCIVVDAAGNTNRLGFIDDPVEWSLESKPLVYSSARKKKVKAEEVERVMTCPSCSLQHPPAQCCPECGHHNQRIGKGVEIINGELVPVKNEKVITVGEARYYYCQLKGYCIQKGWSRSAAGHAFSDKFKKTHIREWETLEPIAPTDEVQKFMKHRMIKYARRRKAA